MSVSVLSQLINLENTRAFPNQFEVSISDINASTSDLFVKNFKFYATKVSLGSYKLEAERSKSNQWTYIKGASIPDIVSITAKETYTWDTLKYFYQWYLCFYDPVRRCFVNGVKGKRRTLTIKALKPSSELPYQPDWDLAQDDTYFGLIITVNNALLVGDVNLPDFSYSSSEPFEHTFSIQSDDITIKINGTEMTSSLDAEGS